MSMINAKIRTSTYITEKELIKDFELMFNNARHYNEENSQVSYLNFSHGHGGGQVV